MTKTIIEVTNVREVHIRIPYWIFKLIAANTAIWLLSAALAVFLAGYAIPAITLAGCGLLFIPLWLGIVYLYWRFYWHITAWLMTLTTFLYAIAIMTLAARGSNLPAVQGTSFQGLELSPIFGLLVLGMIGVVMGFYVLFSRRPSQTNREVTPKSVSDEIDFPKTATLPPSNPTQTQEIDKRTFQQRVANVVAARSGTRTVPEPNGVDISVYRGTVLVGIVKCVERNKPISPLYVRDLAKQKTSIGVSVAYLATPGSFTAETRQEADNLGVRLIDGAALEKMG